MSRLARLPTWLLVSSVLAGLAAGCEATEPQRIEPASSAPLDPVELVARGAELVRLGGCGDCHTPMKHDAQSGMPVPDLSRAYSGHPAGAAEPASTPGPGDQAVIGATFTSFRLPFGTVYAANLTPHSSGLGGWTREQFVATMRSGHRQGKGRALLPPMPWQNLSTLPDATLHAMFAYLQSVTPIDNQVPAPSVPAEVIAAIGKNYDAAPRHAAAGARPAL